VLAYFGRRFIGLLVTLFVVSLLVFLVIRVIPGDPAQIMLGTEATPESLAALRERLGLNAPLYVQYFMWIDGLLSGALGESIRYGVPIGKLVATRFAVTGPLALFAIVIALGLGIPLGIYAAIHRNRFGDYGIMVFSQLGLAVPSFWAGILLILLFAVRLRWFSAGGFVPWSESAPGAIKSLLLPSLALGVIHAAVVTRLTRSTLLEVLNQEYIRTARGKGLVERMVLYKHALRNALIPIVTVVGLQFASLLGGTIIIENVFYLPGLGRLAYQAISHRDLPVVQDVVLLITVLVVVMNLLVDLSYALLDPRIRLE
jgi:peptide/nickel transport system permease protein